MNKQSYFQGGGHENEPEPKKKKYKDKPIDQDLTKARGVFFQNYDLYDTGDPTPGTGLYQHMDEYDSVGDFRKKKREEKMRKRRKALFEAVMVSTASPKEENLKKILKMLKEFNKLNDSNNLADPDDDEKFHQPIVWNSAEPGGSPLGLTDGIYPKEDLEDNPAGNLYYGETEMRTIDF